MHPVLLYFLVYLAAGVIGLISAATLWSITCLLNRHARIRLETVVFCATFVGFAMLFVGKHLENRLIVGVSMLLCGWMVLPVILIPSILIWRFLTWLRRKIVA